MGHYFKSLLQVGFMVPLVKEVIPLFSHILDKVGLEQNTDRYPELADLRSNEYLGYTRFKSELVDATKDGEGEEVETQQQMIYYTKLIPPGTTMLHSFSLNPAANDVEESCFYAFLKTFIETGTVGGSISKGHGQIKCEYYTEDGRLIDGAFLTENEKPFWDFVAKNRDNILHELMTLDQKLQWKAKKEGKE
jgi:hypothetical protein